MAQTGYTPILIYGSSTASATPSASNLTSSANGAELALNYTDGKLYYKDNTGTVQLLASKAGASGSVTSVAQTFTGGIISVAGSPITTSGTLALTVAGTSGGVPYFSSSSAWASSAALTANAIVIGGGAGAAPATTTTGTGVVTAIGNNTNAANGLAVLGAGGALAVAQGGTGLTTTTAYSVVFTGTTATGNFQASAGPGTAGQVLTSNGAGALPTFQTSSGISTGKAIAMAMIFGF